MIKYNNNTIYDWNFDTSNLIKVYRNNAIVFYKANGGSPTPEWKVCFAVVDDISEYTDREFEDVYDNATDKWYKLNNLNQYEEYGIYGEGRNITYYKGKLTIDDGYEYEWNGSSWISMGEVSESSIPDNYVIPFEDSNVKAICVNNWGGNVVAGELTYGEAKQVTNIGAAFRNNGSITSFNELAYFHSLTELSNGEFVGCTHLTDIVIPSNVTKIGYASANRNIFSGCTNLSGVTILSGDETLFFDATANNGSYYMNSSHSSTPMIFPDRLMTFTNSTFGYYDYLTKAYFQCSTPPTNLANSDINNYSKLQNVYCPVGSLSAYQTALAGKNKTIQEYDFETDSLGLLDKEKEWIDKTSSVVVYPKYYSEKTEPLDNLTFNTLAEAQTYAYNNCVYDGMKAIIDGDRYYFDSSDENGWVKVAKYYIVEDVTPNQDSGWTISGSNIYNPDLSYYDDFDLETTSTNYSYKIAKVTIYGYDHFTYYLRSYHGYYASYGYVMATNVDEVSTPPSSINYNSSSAITNTYNWNKSPKSAVNLSNYRRVTYNNLDKTVEHTFYVYFYGRTYNYVGNATILIPKEQTNENWEQVTFSASSNVVNNQKYLYIDGNYSTSGGTNYWYSRWIVGLPSGSHSSYTNYSSYDYCPNVTSSTFTSVAGEQRQVNFTYNGTTSKSLSFRLVDGSGNVLTPSDTVYYNINLYNPCSVSSSSSNLTFPRSQYVKVGGRFNFNNSSNRHYIYGYQPPTLGTMYYVDNYQSAFDIIYTKLNDEAVTITYTTYDPNDSETPAFKTDITYPYSGGTTSSTTLTSYDVPYTYPYTVKQTNTKFSADSQEYTASQASRTINFTLYPNNREFATVADMEAYQYVWEGMKAIVGDAKYKYKNGVWTESSNTEIEYIQCGNGTFSTNGGLQLLTNVTADYYFEVEAQSVMHSTSCMLIGEKSDVEVVSYQLGLCYYSSMYLDYGGGRLDTNINSTTQNQRHTYGACHISGSSYQNVVGLKLDGVVKKTTNATTRVEGLPYLVGGGLRYKGHSASDVKVITNETNVVKLYSVKIYKDYGDTLVGDYIPVINSNNVVTLYDKVSGNYATPYGTLIAGPEV